MTPPQKSQPSQKPSLTKAMSKKTIITCLCHIEVEDNEYEALTVVDNMLKKKLSIIDINTGRVSEKITFTISETITTAAHGRGVRYKKEKEKA